MDADATPKASTPEAAPPAEPTPDVAELEQLRSAAAALEQRIASADAELLAARERDTTSAAAIVAHEARVAELVAERDGLRSTLANDRRADALRRIGAARQPVAAALLLDAAIATQRLDLAALDPAALAALVGHVKAGLAVVGTSPHVHTGSNPSAPPPWAQPRGALLVR